MRQRLKKWGFLRIFQSNHLYKVAHSILKYCFEIEITIVLIIKIDHVRMWQKVLQIEKNCVNVVEHGQLLKDMDVTLFCNLEKSDNLQGGLKS